MSQLVNVIASGLFSAGVAAAIVKYLLDHRSAKAKAVVAEQTVWLDVDTAKLATMDRRLTLVEKAHDAETEALQATISNLKDRLDSATSRITLLEQRVTFEDARYRAALRYIHALRGWISRNISGVDPPTIPAALGAEFDDGLPG
jgi:hypothetical protein